MVHKKEEGTYHHIEKLTKEMPGFLSPGRGLPLLLIPEYSGINKEQRIPDRSKTAHKKPPVKCFLTMSRLTSDWLKEFLLRQMNWFYFPLFTEYDILGAVAANGLISFLMAE